MNDTASMPVYFLLVDDLEENLLSLDALLRREGLVILKARSGPEALELLLQHDVALALLDVQMPGMDGFELAELMRGMERTKRVPIIFLTAGAADIQRWFRGYETGAVDFLYKPLEPTILRSKSDVFFELFRQQQQLKASAEENARLLEESRQYATALQEADTRKNEFLATLAHELRNPLAPIRNGLQILRMSPHSAEAATVRDMMDRQLTHLVRLIDDLLDVARISQGKIVLRKQPITLQAVIQAALEVSRPLLEAARHMLILDMAEKEIWLDADLTRLAQIVSNLVNNAAKYTPNNGRITLTAHENKDGFVKITVADNGLGISKDMLPKIFSLFTQVENSMERAQGGLGIGLALVRELVQMHGGTIAAASEGQGKGSVFILLLPMMENPPQQQQPMLEQAENAIQATGAPLRVLVVDDNVASAKTTGWMLEMMGHQQSMAHDGLAALEAARKMLPDVMMLDIGLPRMNGYDVCRELRRDPAFKDTVFIAQTGWGQETDRQQAFEAGFNYHLTKPVDFDQFSELLNKVRAGKSAA